MKKTTISRWTVILFTVAIAAVNIPVIAQPQNNRIDSLKKEYSYEVCKEYIETFYRRERISLSYGYQRPPVIIPIAYRYPGYFENKIDADIIIPYTKYFSAPYACPVYTKVKPGTNISQDLVKCRHKHDSI